MKVDRCVHMSVCERGNEALLVEAARKSNALCTSTAPLAAGRGEGGSAAVGKLCCRSFGMLF